MDGGFGNLALAQETQIRVTSQEDGLVLRTGRFDPGRAAAPG